MANLKTILVMVVIFAIAVVSNTLWPFDILDDPNTKNGNCYTDINCKNAKNPKYVKC